MATLDFTTKPLVLYYIFHDKSTKNQLRKYYLNPKTYQSRNFPFSCTNEVPPRRRNKAYSLSFIFNFEDRGDLALVDYIYSEESGESKLEGYIIHYISFFLVLWSVSCEYCECEPFNGSCSYFLSCISFHKSKSYHIKSFYKKYLGIDMHIP